ncbi:MAG TPA: hypothetical protein VMK12_18715 [Anaeromyxobacteraceae bacterium]|nr:hypothetical protein [Anaeromyxobacteraceae bacterium]
MDCSARSSPRPTRAACSNGKALGVLLRTIHRRTARVIYRHQETVSGFVPALFGLAEDEVNRLSDGSLFDADRAAFVTNLAIALGRRFDVRFDQLHNDSTTIRLTGQYRAAGAGLFVAVASRG